MLAVAVFLAVLALLAVFAELSRAAPWEMDEYFVLSSYRDHGLTFFFDRLLTWSPRPVSEAILYLYALAVAQAGRPLSAWLLGPLWAMFIASGFVTVRWRAPGLIWRLLAAASLLAIFVVGRRPTEIFYWPVGAAAYLLALAALTLSFFLLADGRTATRAGRSLLTVSLLVVALSVELGAVFVGCYAGIRLLQRLFAPAGSPGERRSASAEIAILLLASVGVLALLATHRVLKADEFASGNQALVHHALPSLLAAVRALPSDTLTLTGDAPWLGSSFWLDLALGLFSKAAFAIGLHWCWHRAKAIPPASRALAAFAVTALAMPLLALAASYYQFGLLCCSRHAELRQVMVFFGLAAVAVLIPAMAQPTVWRVALAPLLLAAAVALPFGSMLPALQHDERERAATSATSMENWRSGHAPGPDMVFRLSPHHELLPDGELPPGRYTAGSADLPWAAQGLFWFFHKQAVTVLPAHDQ